MDVLTIERAFTAWVADRLNLTVDTSIFRGGIPDGVSEGVGVFFGSEVPMTGFYGFHPRTWNAQILAKYNDRDAVMVLLSTLSGLFPCSNFTKNSVEFLTITPVGTPMPYTAEDGGRVKTFLSFNVRLSVLTSGAQTPISE